MLASVKGLQGIATQKAPVIKENAKYSFVELGKFNTSLYTRRILKRFWRVHWRCTTMLQQPAVDRSLNPFCCSRTHPPPSLCHSCWPTPILYNHRKGRSQHPTLCSVWCAAISGCTYCTIKARVCHKNSIHCFKPFPRARILHGISTVVRFNNFRRLTFFAAPPQADAFEKIEISIEEQIVAIIPNVNIEILYFGKREKSCDLVFAQRLD